MKNKIILGIILGITIIGIIYSLEWYKLYKNETYSKSIISEYISEVSLEELNNYINELSSGFIYYCDSSNKGCRVFDNNFKKIISKNGLKDKVVYFNTNNYEIEEYLNYNKIDFKVEGPLIVYYKNNEIHDYLYIKTNEYNEKDIIKFFIIYE